MLITLGMSWIQIYEVQPELLDVARYRPPVLEPELDGVIAPLVLSSNEVDILRYST